jgi:hypothetical protein
MSGGDRRQGIPRTASPRGQGGQYRQASIWARDGPPQRDRRTDGDPADGNRTFAGRLVERSQITCNQPAGLGIVSPDIGAGAVQGGGEGTLEVVGIGTCSWEKHCRDTP